MTVSASQGFAVGLTLMEAGRSSLWAMSWAMLDATRAGLAKNVAYAGALTDCRSAEELASLHVKAAQDALEGAVECASHMAEVTGRFLDEAEAAINETDAGVGAGVASRGRSRFVVREQTMASQGHSLEHGRPGGTLSVHPMTPEQPMALVQEARAARLREHGCPIARSGAEGRKVARAIR